MYVAAYKQSEKHKSKSTEKWFMSLCYIISCIVNNFNKVKCLVQIIHQVEYLKIKPDLVTGLAKQCKCAQIQILKTAKSFRIYHASSTFGRKTKLPLLCHPFVPLNQAISRTNLWQIRTPYHTGVHADPLLNISVSEK